MAPFDVCTGGRAWSLGSSNGVSDCSERSQNASSRSSDSPPAGAPSPLGGSAGNSGVRPWSSAAHTAPISRARIPIQPGSQTMRWVVTSTIETPSRTRK